jgi:predicted  nucleic acid-binding Zn-ribbon protein
MFRFLHTLAIVGGLAGLLSAEAETVSARKIDQLSVRVDSLERAVRMDLPDFVRGEVDALMRKYTEVNNELVRLQTSYHSAPDSSGVSQAELDDLSLRVAGMEQRIEELRPQPKEKKLLFKGMVSIGLVAVAGILLALIGAP